MTTKSGYKRNESKWKSGHDDNVMWDIPKPFLTLKFSALILVAIISIVVLKFLVVLSKYNIVDVYVVRKVILSYF